MNRLPRLVLTLTLLTGTAGLLTVACSSPLTEESAPDAELELRAKKKDGSVSDAVAETSVDGSDASVDGSSKKSFDGLSFYYGNQIWGSELTIDKAGVVTRTERTCCPPKFTKFPGNLAASELQLLAADAAEVALAGHETVAGSITAEGSQTGSLTVSVGGAQFPVIDVTRNADFGKPDVVTRTLAVAAKKRLVDRVNGLVDRDVPSNL